MTSVKSQPPLLHTYTAPSGPIASPFGLPPFSETTSTRPRDTRGRRCGGRARRREASRRPSRPDLRERTVRTRRGWFQESPWAGSESPRPGSVKATSSEQQLRHDFAVRRISERDAVRDDLLDGDHRDAMLLREQLEVRHARRGTVIVEDLARDGDRFAAGEHREVDRRLGVPAPLEDAVATRRAAGTRDRVARSRRDETTDRGRAGS